MYSNESRAQNKQQANARCKCNEDNYRPSINYKIDSNDELPWIC